MRAVSIAALLALLLCLNSSTTFTAQDAPAATTILLGDCLVLPSVGGGGRSPVRADPFESQLIRSNFAAPKAGDKVKRLDGTEVEWRSAKANEEGWLSDRNMAGGYAWWSVQLKDDGVWLLNARGHGAVYVNGELRGGDVYNYGNSPVPVALKAGTNHFCFLMGRGSIRAQLEYVASPGLHVIGDWTLPDLAQGHAMQLHFGAVAVLNSTSRTLQVTGYVSGSGINVPPMVGSILPYSSRKIRFSFAPPKELMPGKHQLTLRVSADNDPQLTQTATFDIQVVSESDRRKVTFISNIDGSVQYYSVVPARPLPGQTDKPGIVLSLHGASVEASGQAGAYSPKSWCHIVCPTNRRPFGFDWEDWGRIDALEVLEHAKATLDYEPSKVWLTGHSMGGHGTWSVGAHFPDKFAAIGPSAGWESFDSYGGGGGHPPQHKLSPMLTRGANQHRTLLLKHNYKSQGIYILHGDADDNVPVTQARMMRDALKEFHNELHYFEQPGAGHWWDDGHDDGADCLDWAPMFDMFAKRRLPHASEVMQIDFTTCNPGNTHSCHWVAIHMQRVQHEPSRVQLRAEPNKGRIIGQTSNVTRLRLAVSTILQPREKVGLSLDGQELECDWPKSGVLWLERAGDAWSAAAEPSLKLKGPHRYGMLKGAMRRNVVLVYGTKGDEAENAQMLAKVRYDCERWQYQGNGTFTVVADSDFDPAKVVGRDIVLYGNADINSAFSLVAGAPISVRRAKVVIGKRELAGDDLCLLFCYPRPDCELSSVCVIGGTGLAGLRLADRLGYFISGASFPDVFLYGREMLEKGTGGVLAAGLLGEDWSIERGEIVWRDEE